MKRFHRKAESSSVSLKKFRSSDALNGKPIWSGITFCVLPLKFGPVRQKLLETQITKHSGNLFKHGDNFNCVQYCIVEETITFDILFENHYYSQFENASFLKCSWISHCVQADKLLPIHNYVILENTSKSKPEVSILIKSAKDESHVSVLDKIDHDDSLNKFVSNPLEASKAEENDQSVKKSADKFVSNFVCSQSSERARINFNKHIVTELESLSRVYGSKNDKWRALSYQKAIIAVKNYHKAIESWEEAKSIKGIGKSLADKIKEIIDSGRLRKVKEICNDEETETLQLFMDVWGAGAVTANKWYNQGFRSLKDLDEKAHLTKNQRIGVLYYDEFKARIPRSEVREIEQQVKSVVDELGMNLKVTVCGSYRRGKETCGDVDILVMRPNDSLDVNVLQEILTRLKRRGFLTDDLVIQENNGNQQKYLGVCKLKGKDKLHRRIDIIVVPNSEYAPALLYFTGSAHFNRSMRLLAIKKGMSLSEHGLVIKKGKKSITNHLLDTPTEEAIFHHLELQYREPAERDH